MVPIDKISSAAAIDKLNAVFVFILSFLVLGSKFSMKTALGVICVSIGTILML